VNCEECHSFGVTLRAGDILIYGIQDWHHLGLPQGEGISITYMTSFTVANNSQ
jgi:hypothetical protein